MSHAKESTLAKFCLLIYRKRRFTHSIALIKCGARSDIHQLYHNVCKMPSSIDHVPSQPVSSASDSVESRSESGANPPFTAINVTSNVGRSTKKRKLHSTVWDHITQKKNENGEVINCCNHEGCTQQFSVNSSTSTLRTHLKKHGFFLDNLNQHRFAPNGGLVQTVSAPSNQKQVRYELFTCRWIVSAVKPFSIVESKEYIDKEKFLDSSIVVPSRQTVQRRIQTMFSEYQIKVAELLSNHKGKISITTDAWSSRVYRGYMAVTAHWIDEKWQFNSMTLDFKRFPTPHSGDNTCIFLRNILDEWKISGDIQCITTDNASDVCKGVRLLFQQLKDDFPDRYTTLDSFHVRCIAHVINIGVKECISSIDEEVGKIREAINTIKVSVKRRDVFEAVRKELKIQCELPSLDCQTRWSSTFQMLKSAFKCRRVLNATLRRIGGLGELLISDEEWKKSNKICEFLESAALITERQSGYICYSQYQLKTIQTTQR